jgi:hypothetical protein
VDPRHLQGEGTSPREGKEILQKGLTQFRIPTKGLKVS